MMFTDSSRAACRWASAGLLLALVLAAACGGGGRPRADDPRPQSQTPTGSESVGSDPGADPAGGEGSDTASDELDAGPVQFQFLFDGSTTPSSEYVHDVDAAAGEAVRGLAGDDAGSDSGPDGG
jgi:hypothetical protein